MEFWLFLPEHFKRSVIKKLDYKSRCRLRKCSKLDKSLVDSCPITLDQVNFEPRLGNQVYMSIEEINAPEKLLYDRCLTTKEVLQDFLFIFRNPKSKVKKLSIAHFNFQRQPDAVNDFVHALLTEMKACYTSNFELRIEKLAFHWGEMKETVFMELIKKLDSKFFKAIFFRKFPVKSPDLLTELVSTEQWKNLKEIRIQEKLTIPLEKIHPVNVLSVSFHNLSAESIWGYVKKYRSTSLPLQSFFQICTSQNLPINEILEKFDVLVKNEPLQEKNYYFKHTQRFQLPWSSYLILVVKIASRQIKGTICREENPEDDFDVLEEILVQEIV